MKALGNEISQGKAVRLLSVDARGIRWPFPCSPHSPVSQHPSPILGGGLPGTHLSVPHFPHPHLSLGRCPWLSLDWHQLHRHSLGSLPSCPALQPSVPPGSEGGRLSSCTSLPTGVMALVFSPRLTVLLHPQRRSERPPGPLGLGLDQPHSFVSGMSSHLTLPTARHVGPTPVTASHRREGTRHPGRSTR